jgi:hypothetical protein
MARSTYRGCLKVRFHDYALPNACPIVFTTLGNVWSSSAVGCLRDNRSQTVVQCVLADVTPDLLALCMCVCVFMGSMKVQSQKSKDSRVARRQLCYRDINLLKMLKD